MNNATTIPSYDEWLNDAYLPLRGREEGDDPDPVDPPVPPADPPADPPVDPPADPDPNEPDDADLDEVTRLRADLARERAAKASAEAAVQRAKADVRAAREEAAKKGGNWEQVAKERSTDLEEANERASGLEVRAVKAEEDLDTLRREIRVTGIASKLSFRDPADAMKMLSVDATGDDKTAERALRKLAEEKSYLVDERKARGRSMNGGGGSTGLTREQIKAMSPNEMQARLPEVKEALARMGAGG